ncbi:MAG: hypothetical protein H7A45_10380 [Verrucomicrobiales bacterium]|nr:hypothetical protein [Verrucomicrobiales bacterium]MCP5528229.1 hypothetical protein [Verrucomicrobiales bacterium]
MKTSAHVTLVSPRFAHRPAALLASLSIICLAQAGNVLVNGSFELGWTGWDHTGETLLHSNPDFVPDGSQSAYFNAYDQMPDGKVSQQFPTVPGVSYTLEFIYGVYTPNVPQTQQSMAILVEGQSELLNQLAVVVGGRNPVPFVAFAYTFTADSVSTVLSFIDNATYQEGLSADAIVDRVSVSPVPEPAESGGVIALAALGIVFSLRRRFAK